MKRFFVICMLLILLSTTIFGGIKLANADEILEITSKSACLVDYASGNILYAKNENEHLPIASMVKMMTILLALEEIESGKLTEDTMVTTTENASGMGGSQVFIDPYVEYKAGDLLKSVIIASANDASVALAEHISGSEKSFVSKMNEKAKELGMNNTNYANCTGLPAPEQYSCASDCAVVLRKVGEFDLYHKYSTIWMDELVHPSGRVTGLVNTNRLVKYYDGCDGGKTGSTNEAGCCLSASAKRNDMKLISVVIGAKNSQTRFNECSKLFNYGFANYENHLIVDDNSALFLLPVNKGKIDNAEVFAKDRYSAVTKKGSKLEYDVTYVKPEKINAPSKAGCEVGKAIISKDGNVIKEIDLILRNDIEPLSLKDCFDRVVKAW